MGYTHYWTLHRELPCIPAPASAIIHAILSQAHRENIIQLEFNDPRPPLIDDLCVYFNGKGREGHETFAFDVRDTGFNFCKTARKRYDWHVMAVLIVLKHHLRDDLILSSDGRLDDEWTNVREYMADTYGCMLDKFDKH